MDRNFRENNNYVNKIIIMSIIRTRFLFFVCSGENVSHDNIMDLICGFSNF